MTEFDPVLCSIEGDESRFMSGGGGGRWKKLWVLLPRWSC